MTAIMVVEDEGLVAEDIAETLRGMGYDIAGPVASGEACLKHVDSQRPDLVLMDVQLEGEADGIETAELLRSRFDVPVVYLTAFSDQPTVDRAKETDAYGYLVKPFRPGELRSAVEVALAKHRTDNLLREREKWFSTTLRAISDAVITVDPEGRITFVNPSAEELLAREAQEMLGQEFSDVVQLIHEQTRVPLGDRLGKALRTRKGGTLPPHVSILTSRGERPVEDGIAPIVDSGERLLGAVVVLRDVSDKRQITEQLALADRMVSLGTLVAGVAHEINNPLTYVLGNATLASEGLGRIQESVGRFPDPAASLAREIADELSGLEVSILEIEDGAKRVQRIVRDLRTFSRPGGGLGVGSALGALEWALRISESMIQPRAQLLTELHEVPEVRGDEGRLGQVFLNLLINAAQAIPEGKPARHSIRVSIGVAEDERVLVTISDTGAGMPPEVLKRIFDPFFTTKPAGSGTGLGLSICHGFVEAMGGRIEAESELGHGATFRVYLEQATRPPSERPRTEHGAASDRARLLVVDDEELILASLRRLLAPHHEVLTVPNAREALRLLSRGEYFDVLFCDVIMPLMDGRELYRKVRDRWPELASRMVFITGNRTHPDTVRFLESITNRCLEKPLVREELLELIGSVLARSPSPG